VNHYEGSGGSCCFRVDELLSCPEDGVGSSSETSVFTNQITWHHTPEIFIVTTMRTSNFAREISVFRT
jgi:hypothetical protein